MSSGGEAGSNNRKQPLAMSPAPINGNNNNDDLAKINDWIVIQRRYFWMLPVGNNTFSPFGRAIHNIDI